jgi:hypothetical protein
MHTLQVFHRDVRIHLRRSDIGVTEQTLHAAQVCAMLDHVCRAGVPQHVR